MTDLVTAVVVLSCVVAAFAAVSLAALIYLPCLVWQLYHLRRRVEALEQVQTIHRTEIDKLDQGLEPVLAVMSGERRTG